MAAYISSVQTGTVLDPRLGALAWTAQKREPNPYAEPHSHAASPEIRLATDEDRLAVAFAERDQGALAEVYRLYAATFYAVAVRILNVEQEAEDCVHDTLLRIWSKPNTYCTERGRLVSLLIVAVRNDALSRRRSVAKHHEIEQRLETPVRVEDFTNGLRDHVECAKLRQALEALTPELREPIVRAYMRYQTHEQISRELNVPLGTIKSRLIIGLRKLHGELIAGKQRV